jgi:hypothetical protein
MVPTFQRNFLPPFPEDRGSRFLWNVGTCSPNYVSPYRRRPPWEPTSNTELSRCCHFLKRYVAVLTWLGQLESEYTISLLEKLGFGCYSSVNWSYVFHSRGVIVTLPWLSPGSYVVTFPLPDVKLFQDHDSFVCNWSMEFQKQGRKSHCSQK